MSIRVLLAEDHGLIRDSFGSLLRADYRVDLVGAFPDLPTLLYAIDETQPDLVLTDIRMPPDCSDEGIQVARHCSSRHPRTAVLLLSQFVGAAYLRRLLEYGYERRGYLLKERVADGDELVEAILTVAAGGSVIDPSVVEEGMRALARRGDPGLARLSRRETEVLAAMAEGRNNAAIARSLVITQRAVEKHINAVFTKLGVSTEDGIHPRVRAVLFYLFGRAQ